jgi:hypothetical protein
MKLASLLLQRRWRRRLYSCIAPKGTVRKLKSPGPWTHVGWRLSCRHWPFEVAVKNIKKLEAFQDLKCMGWIKDSHFRLGISLDDSQSALMDSAHQLSYHPFWSIIRIQLYYCTTPKGMVRKLKTPGPWTHVGLLVSLYRTKGQIISKGLFGVFEFSQDHKQTNSS